MKKSLLVLLVLGILFGLAGCTPTVSGAVLLQSDVARDTSPVVAESDLQTLVNGNNAFALDLYQVLRDSEGNLFFSPYSISQALAMAYAGSRAETEKSIAAALSYSLSQSRLHPAFNYLELLLKQRGQNAKGKDGEGFRLNVANAAWGQRDFQFLAEYLDTLAKNYGSGLRIVDFISQTEQARQIINNWVSEQTGNKIKDLIPPGSVNSMTRLVLTNAVYFNAAWQHPFNTTATSPEPFHLVNGKDVTVPMMHQTGSFRYAEGSGYQALELPYDGQELSMVVLLPKPGQLDAFQKALDAEQVKGILGGLTKSQVVLSMPRFQFESATGLKQALSKLGMGVAFTSDADFSGMDGKRDLFIQDVLHKGYVGVDEAGTEAAAASAVIVGVTSMPLQTVEFKMDRPFIFLIRDNQTGSIIFLGRVMSPFAG